MPPPSTAPQTSKPLPLHQISLPPSTSPTPSLPPLIQPAQSSLPVSMTGHQTDGLVPRYHKLEFPTFGGKEDPLGWLNRCEQFFKGQRTLEGDKVWLAFYHLTGVAQPWFTMVERTNPTMSWAMFKDLCNDCFGPLLRNNPLGELARLHFRTTIKDYQERFSTLLCHADPMAPVQQVQIFTAGLPDRIHIDVELLQPQDLQQAFRLTRAYERRSQSVNVFQQQHPSGRSTRPSRPSVPVPVLAAPDPATTTPAGTAQTPSPRPFKRLTPSEMAKRRRQGLCYNCDEPYVHGHRCQRLFYLKVTNFDEEDPPATTEDDQDDREPVFSLHALTGICTEDTMQLKVYINGQELVAFLDTGSTHNFVNYATARKIGLTLEPTPGRHVKVGNGDFVFCQGRTQPRSQLSMRSSILTPMQSHWTHSTSSLGWRSSGLSNRSYGTWTTFAWPSGAATTASNGKALGRLTPTLQRRLFALRAVSTNPAPMMDRLLQSFEHVFAEPRTVPLARSCDHRIHLKPRTASAAVCPYHYPQL
ncbi:hypothetical protein BS78_K226700 [Paspalum vaginatum]|uniref:Retrotransposon gag domain-containing protein n=1 Tax=Paspalum vaginatum TaxID=158149 RepID=A0A9W7X5R9_9POAL|nr:hypothetical protein BS78_K226700 [Paspalum vaginatum]